MLGETKIFESESEFINIQHLMNFLSPGNALDVMRGLIGILALF